jgi:hypothetical protein
MPKRKKPESIPLRPPKPKRREKVEPPSVLWQKKELHTDERFVFDLAEAFHQMESDATAISIDAQERAFNYYSQYGIDAVVDRVLELHEELEKLGRRQP